MFSAQHNEKRTVIPMQMRGAAHTGPSRTFLALLLSLLLQALLFVWKTVLHQFVPLVQHYTLYVPFTHKDINN